MEEDWGVSKLTIVEEDLYSDTFFVLCGQTLGWVWLRKAPAVDMAMRSVQGVVTPISTILTAASGFTIYVA